MKRMIVFSILLLAAAQIARPLRLTAEVGRFAPNSLAGLVLETASGRGERMLDEVAEDTGMPDVIAGLLKDRLDDDDEDVRGVWTLNAACPLIERLASSDDTRSPRMEAALRLLLHQARLLAGHRLGPKDLEDLAQDTSRVLSLLLSLEDEP